MLRRLVGTTALDIIIVQFRNEKVSNHGSIPITIDCNVVVFIVLGRRIPPAIKRTKQSVFLDGLRSSPGKGLNVCKCVVPLRHESTLKHRQAASPLVRFMEEKRVGRLLTTPYGIFPRKRGFTEPNHVVTGMLLKATYNAGVHLAL
ncbi:hypothetical protein TNCV_1257851 [Trichonephila clavipes]|nr:hypothetical protein TNCV_1257851 [Trichonephila clavipes]